MNTSALKVNNYGTGEPTPQRAQASRVSPREVLLDALRVVSGIGCEFVDEEVAAAVMPVCTAMVHAISAEMEIGMEHPSARASVAEFLAEAGRMSAALCQVCATDIKNDALAMHVTTVAQMMARVSLLLVRVG